MFRRTVRSVVVSSLIGAAILGLAQPAGATTFTPSLLRVIDASAWAQPATDPMGLGYNSTSNRLLVVDSEVEETVPGQPAPCCWHNVNFWETSLSGTVASTSNLTGFTTEPTDVGFNPSNGHYFISDDNSKTIYEITPGGDGRIGTSDDTRRSFRLGYDCEGLDYGGGSLWIADGAAKKIHRIQPGPNGLFEGAGDDVVTEFDVAAFGMMETEDVFYDSANGTLFIGSRKNTTVIETTLAGSLLNSYNLAGTGMKNTSGLVVAPTSNDATKRSLYIADRGSDNDANPAENDGKIFEYLLGAALPPGHPPTVTNPGGQVSDENEEISLQIVASDEDGDTLTFTAAHLPPGLSISSSTGLISGTVSSGAATSSPFAAEVTASDGPRSATAAFEWRIRDLIPPAAPTGLAIGSQTTGLALDWNNGTESDLAGYDVWRSPTGDSGSYTKLNTAPLTASDYLDTQATAGATSFYEVLSVDLSGNASPALPGSALRSKIAFVSSAVKNGKVTRLTITKPAGVTTGDVLIAGIGVKAAATITPPSGWTKILEHTTAGSPGVRQAIFTKLAGSSEPSSYDFTLGSSSVPAVGAMLAYRGADLPPVTSGGQINASSRSITAPSLTPTGPAVEVGFFGTRANTTVTPPAGMLEQAEKADSNGVTIEAVDDVVDAGPLGTRVATAGTSAANTGQVVVLRPSNHTPIVTNPGNQESLELTSATLPIAASDDEGETLAYSATGLPAGLTIDPVTGVVDGTIVAGASGSSPYTTTVNVTDGTTTGSTSFIWTIRDLVAPAAPAGFSAASQTNALVLDWANSTEPDLAGYNIYRSASGDTGSFTKLNAALLTTSNYADNPAPAGATSFYEITAVDSSGNESAALHQGATRARIEYLASASRNGSVTALVIDKPSGVASGDVLLAVVGHRGSAFASTPSGWTKVVEHASSGSTPLRQSVFSKVAGSSEPSTYSFTVGSSAVPATGTISAYRGALLPVALSGGQANASSASITAPSLSPVDPQSVEVGFFGTALATTVTPPAGMIEQAETAISSTSNKVTIETADDVVDPGATGTRVATAAAAGVNVGQVVVLKPAGPQPPAVTNPGSKESFEGNAVNLPIAATDAEGDPFTFSATGLPTGLSIDPATGVISGTVAVGASASSPYSVTVSATDATGAGSATFTWVIKDPNAPVPTSINVVMAAAADDMEESATGAIDAGSSDLEVVQEATLQTVGLRFAGVNVPAGGTITAASIQFQVDEVSTGAANLTIKAQLADSAPAFTTTAGDLSSRPTTSIGASWAPPDWPTIGAAGDAQRTADLSSVLQAIVGRTGWAPGNAVAFIVTGTGKRVAESFEGGPLDPTLHIEYTTGPVGPPANSAPVVTNPGPKSNVEESVVNLAITATDADGDAITYAATGLPGGLSMDAVSGVISGTVATGAAAASPYTVTVTASDATHSGNAVFTWTITTASPPPPTSTTLNVVMAAAADDMEESSTGVIDAGSSDLELVQEGSLQTVGLRFAGVNVPAGATITAAWIQFQVDEASSGAVNLTIKAEATDNAPAFTTASNNISARARTTAGATWAPPDWPTIGAATDAQRSADLSAVLQEIVARSGWAPGHAMAFIVTGTGKRVAESYEGGPLDPTLHIEYTI